jgi:hypothetical protein
MNVGTTRSLATDIVLTLRSHFPHCPPQHHNTFTRNSTLEAHHLMQTLRMAFQHSNNRRGAKAKQPGTKTTLTDMPEEILLHILPRIDITAVLRLRATSRFFVPACTEAIRDKLKVLYVHPSPGSVLRALKIIESDLGSDVEEVCFVSQVPRWWWFGHCARGFGFAWPSRKTRNEQVSAFRYDPPVFSKSYQDLLSAMTGLERLQTFSFQESCDRPGLNMLSAQRLTNWMKTIGLNVIPSKFLTADFDLDAYESDASQSPNFEFADIDALDAVLNHTGITVTRLKLSHELLRQPYHPNRVLGIVRPQTLTRLDLLATTYWRGCDWHRLCRGLLRSAAPTLVELKLALRNSILANDYDEEYSMCTLDKLLYESSLPGAEFIHLPKVERLEFYAGESRQPPSFLGLHMTQWFDLETFLAGYCPELRFFCLTDFIPVVDESVVWRTNRDHTMMNIMHRHLGVPVREITTGLADLEAQNAREWEVLSDR